MKKFLLVALAAFTLALPGQQAAAQTKPRHKTVQAKEKLVHITRTGAKYHAAGCRYLRRSDYVVSLSEALSRGLTPCSVCNP